MVAANQGTPGDRGIGPFRQWSLLTLRMVPIECRINEDGEEYSGLDAYRLNRVCSAHDCRFVGRPNRASATHRRRHATTHRQRSIVGLCRLPASLRIRADFSLEI